MKSITIPKTVTLADSGVFASELTDALRKSKRVTLDASSLEAADLSLLQILTSAHKFADLNGTQMEISVPTAGILARLMDDFGLHSPPRGPAIIRNDVWFGVMNG